MLQVLVAPDPTIMEYCIPIISAVGFLLLLGSAAIFMWPTVIENKLIPKFRNDSKELVMFSTMTLLLLLYLPLLNYTRASYLTGAFLAGMSISQIHWAYESFIKNTHHLMVWLLRVFFAASIGFQIPITKLGDIKVIGLGIVLYLAVAMKFPLGFFVPKFDKTVKYASYDPYHRDVVLTGLAM